ncbi:MAG: hypothetical protein JWR16_3528 [Nevskia sp.]|nr:hypothetical protein [Nevskia sp.]
MSPGRTLATLLNLAVVAFFAWAVQHYWGWARLLAPWQQMPLATLLLALCGMLGSYAIRALRIYIAEAEIPRGAYWQCLRLILLNNSLNLLLPARSGEASFPILLKRWFGIDLARGTGTLLWLRLLDLHVLASVGAACAAAGWQLQAHGVSRLIWLVAALAAAAPLLLFALHGRLSRALAGRGGKLVTLAQRGLSGIPAHAGGVLRDLLLTWSSWAVKLSALGWVLSQLAQLPPLVGVLGAIGGDLSTVLPVHAPGGFGTYEAGVIAVLAPATAPSGALLAAAVNLHLLLLTTALLAGAAAWLTGLGRRSPTPQPRC